MVERERFEPHTVQSYESDDGLADGLKSINRNVGYWQNYRDHLARRDRRFEAVSDRATNEYYLLYGSASTYIPHSLDI